MKKYFLLSNFLVLMSVFMEAQISVHGSLPVWGPGVTTEQYYYLPEIDSYYDIRRSQFICLNNGYWIRSKYLPSRYRNYNLNTGHVVVINDYRGSRPYIHFRNNKLKYYKNNRNWKDTKNTVKIRNPKPYNEGPRNDNKEKGNRVKKEK